MPSDAGPPGDGTDQGPPRAPGFFSRDHQIAQPGQEREFPVPGSPPGEKSGFRAVFLRGVLVMASFAFFGVIVWYAYLQGHRAGIESTPPLIKSDLSPTRVRPDKPGGLEVPHQDKLVYDRLDPAARETRVERLLPPPEEPLARPKPPELLKPPEPSFPQTANQADIPLPVIPDSPPPPPLAPRLVPPLAAQTDPRAPRPLISPPAAGAASAAPSATLPPPPPPATAAAAPAPTTAPITGLTAALPAGALPAGAYKIQLGAFRSPDAVGKEWGRLQLAHADLLADMTLNIEEANLGAKGIFYRLQAGPLDSRAAAKSLCDQLARRKAACLVVRR